MIEKVLKEQLQSDSFDLFIADLEQRGVSRHLQIIKDGYDETFQFMTNGERKKKKEISNKDDYLIYVISIAVETKRVEVFLIRKSGEIVQAEQIPNNQQFEHLEILKRL